MGASENLQSQLIVGSVLSGDVDEAITCRDRSLFEQWQNDLVKNAEDSQEIVLLELKARLLRLARCHRQRPAVPVTSVDRKSTGGSAHLEKAELMACYIARNFKSRLLIKDIAESVDLHPDYAATLFRKTFGTTLNTLITRHRVAEAQRLLVTSNERIVNIALESGFESLSRFNRAFKQMTGMTPRAFRKECRASRG